MGVGLSLMMQNIKWKILILLSKYCFQFFPELFNMHFYYPSINHISFFSLNRVAISKNTNMIFMKSVEKLTDEILIETVVVLHFYFLDIYFFPLWIKESLKESVLFIMFFLDPSFQSSCINLVLKFIDLV